MSTILNGLQLIEDVFSGQLKLSLVSFGGNLLGSQFLAGTGCSRHGFRLLLLDRLAFPAACHCFDYSPSSDRVRVREIPRKWRLIA